MFASGYSCRRLSIRLIPSSYVLQWWNNHKLSLGLSTLCFSQQFFFIDIDIDIEKWKTASVQLFFSSAQNKYIHIQTADYTRQSLCEVNILLIIPIFILPLGQQAAYLHKT